MIRLPVRVPLRSGWSPQGSKLTGGKMCGRIRRMLNQDASKARSFSGSRAQAEKTEGRQILSCSPPSEDLEKPSGCGQTSEKKCALHFFKYQALISSAVLGKVTTKHAPAERGFAPTVSEPPSWLASASAIFIPSPL